MTNPLLDLNNDIWQPFSEAYASGDVERYLGLHAADFTWVWSEKGVIEGLADYRARIRQSFAEMPAEMTFDIAFRFTERITSERLASERGVFRMVGDGPKGRTPVRFGRFHTVARRDGGRWRLVVDYDGGRADKAEFDAARPVDDIHTGWVRPAT